MSVFFYPLLVFFVDALPQVQVAPGGQFVYKPSSFTARNGTLVTFHFPKYELYRRCLSAILMPYIVAQSLIP